MVTIAYKTINYIVEDHVGWIILDRVDYGNALNYEMCIELAEVAWKCLYDEDVRVVVLTGKGKSFSFGGDLKKFSEQGDEKGRHLKDVTAALNEFIRRMNQMKKPVITGINGTAAGAGFGLSIIGDIVIATEEVKLTMAYTNVALTPDGAISYFLPRIIGTKKALELTLLNKVLTANEAHEWGLITRVVEKDQLSKELEVIAKQLVKGPVNALGKSRQLINRSLEETLESQMALESQFISEQITSKEGEEGVSSFIEKRKPTYM